MITVKIIENYNVEDNYLYKVKHNCNEYDKNVLIIINNINDLGINNNIKYITSNVGVFNALKKCKISSILIKNIVPLDDGDILYINNNSTAACVVYQVKSSHNVLFVTGECNSSCIMCPQPPKDDDIDFLDLSYKIINLIECPPDFLSVSGGEPTLLGNRLISLIEYIYSKWENINIQILTNGRLLSDFNYTSSLMNVCKDRKIFFAIPLHADILEIHDTISQRKGSFDQTIRGLYNLSLYNANIELRIVVMRYNVHRLKKIILYIGRYITFIQHISIMQMEPQGFARKRWSEFYIDPSEYMNELIEMTDIANTIGIPIRLYNYQLCTLPESLYEYAYQSISDWKNVFRKECQMCKKLLSCAGFFSSQDSDNYISSKIHAL